MEFNEFNNRWRNAFGYCLTERQGAEQWRAFLESELCNDAVVAMLLKQYSERYNQLIAEESPHAKDRIPTLDAFKARYFAMIRERNTANSKPTGCRTCGGNGHVFALAPCVDDRGRVRAPENFTTVELKRVYWGVEVYDCPTCRSEGYGPNYALRQRVLENSMPEVVRPGEHGSPYGYPVGGDAIIKNVLEARFQTERVAREPPVKVQPEVHPEVQLPPEVRELELEEAFPLEGQAPAMA